MDKKMRTMWILIILMWICYLSAVIVNIFSDIAYWILLGVWAVIVIAIIVVNILIAIDFKKQERELNRTLEEDRKHLEELIKGYLAVSLKTEEENKSDQE